VAVVEDGWVTVGHVGDSRLYVLRERRIVKITHDHSPIGEREDRGELDERSAMRHPSRNEVYRAVGTEEHAPFDADFVEIARFQLAPDHALLLCSDGLTDLVTTREILEVVKSSADDPEAVVERLVAAALDAGGKDNVSVIFAAGPRFGRAWRLGRGIEADGDAVVHPSAREQARRWAERRGVQFALGAVCGALIVTAIVAVGKRAAGRAPAGTVAADAPRVLAVGSTERFHTIGDALDAARAGDTVRVAPGTYPEQVRLEAGVSLVASTPRSAVLAPTAAGGPVVGIVAESMGSGRISGFAIHGTDRAPLDIGVRLADAGVAVEDVEVSGARVAGVLIEGPRPAALHASWIHDNAGAGVVVRAGGVARLAHNLVERNGRASRVPAPGIDLEPGARAELVQNVIAGNAGPGVRGVTAAARRSVLAANRFERGGRRSGPPIAPAPPGPAP
jgi:hypothetical protein